MRQGELLRLLCLTGLVAFAAVIVYLFTLAPSITWAHNGADSGDFAAAIATGGVPHPTGYPTYLLIATLFAKLPWGDVAYRLNLLSALAAALAAGLMVLFVRTVLGTVSNAQGISSSQTNPALDFAALSAGLVFAFSPLVWSQAVITEVYTLNACFFLLLMLLGWWSHRKGDYGIIALTFLTLGVGLGNHLSLVLALPALVWLLQEPMRTRPLKFFVCALPALFAGLCVYLIIPSRAVSIPPINWGGASNWQGFWWLLTGHAYHRLAFALPIVNFPMRLAAWLRIMFVGMNGWGLPLGFLGLSDLLERDRKLAISTLLIFVFYSLYAILYDTTDSYVYLIPAVVVVILWMAQGIYWTIGLIRPYLKRHNSRGTWLWRALLLGIFFLSLVGVPWHWSDQDLSTNTEAIDYALDALDTVPPGSLIIVEGDAHTFSLWYARYAMEYRSDVAVVNDALLQFDWYRIILGKYHFDIMDRGRVSDLTTLLAANVGKRPVYFSHDPGALPFENVAVQSDQIW